MDAHKNKSRAPLKPLNLPTLALSVGGLGFLRPMPGTWGSVPPAAIAGLMVLAGASVASERVVMGLLVVLGTGACVLWGRYAEERFSRKDAPEVVADETAGCAIVVAAACEYQADAFMMLAQIAGAFVLFRIADILKPWPIRLLERLPRGWGVALDDLGAGVLALVVFHLSMLVLAKLGVR